MPRNIPAPLSSLLAGSHVLEVLQKVYKWSTGPSGSLTALDELLMANTHVTINEPRLLVATAMSLYLNAFQLAIYQYSREEITSLNLAHAFHSMVSV